MKTIIHLPTVILKDAGICMSVMEVLGDLPYISG